MADVGESLGAEAFAELGQVEALRGDGGADGLIDALKTFDLIYIITRGGPGTTTYTLPLHSYALGFESFLMGQSAAVAWFVVIIVNVFVFVFLRLLAREQA